MTAKVFCMASAKGGSGKTILSATFATFLASMGKRVLLIDTDAATNGLSLLYIRNIISPASGAGLFEEQAQPNYALSTVSLARNLDLLPASYVFHNTEDTPIGKYQSALEAGLDIFRNSYDYIFLDAQAGSDEYAALAMQPGISDTVVIVSEWDPISAAGVERLKALFPKSLQYSRTWILLNKVLPEFVNSSLDSLEVFRYLSPIPWDADVVRAYARRELALDLKEGNEYTAAVVQTLRSMLEGEDRAQLEGWLKRRSRELREPLVAERKKVEEELASLREERRLIEKRRSLLRGVIVGLAVVIVVAAAGIGVAAFSSSSKSNLLVSTGSGLAAVVAAVVPLVVWVLFRETASSSIGREESVLEARIARLKALEELEFERRATKQN